MRDWCRFTDVDASYIDPGSPWQNGVCESFNGRFRDEFLSCEVNGLIIASHYAVALASDTRRSDTPRRVVPLTREERDVLARYHP